MRLTASTWKGARYREPGLSGVGGRLCQTTWERRGRGTPGEWAWARARDYMWACLDPGDGKPPSPGLEYVFCREGFGIAKMHDGNGIKGGQPGRENLGLYRR